MADKTHAYFTLTLAKSKKVSLDVPVHIRNSEHFFLSLSPQHTFCVFFPIISQESRKSVARWFRSVLQIYKALASSLRER